MDPTAALLALVVGTEPNATWGGLKALAGRLAKNQVEFDPKEIFRKTLVNSLGSAW